jgi:hypothetical protein
MVCPEFGQVALSLEKAADASMNFARREVRTFDRSQQVAHLSVLSRAQMMAFIFENRAFEENVFSRLDLLAALASLVFVRDEFGVVAADVGVAGSALDESAEGVPSKFA